MDNLQQATLKAGLLAELDDVVLCTHFEAAKK